MGTHAHTIWISHIYISTFQHFYIHTCVPIHTQMRTQIATDTNTHTVTDTDTHFTHDSHYTHHAHYSTQIGTRTYRSAHQHFVNTKTSKVDHTRLVVGAHRRDHALRPQQYHVRMWTTLITLFTLIPLFTTSSAARSAAATGPTPLKNTTLAHPLRNTTHAHTLANILLIIARQTHPCALDHAAALHQHFQRLRMCERQQNLEIFMPPYRCAPAYHLHSGMEFAGDEFAGDVLLACLKKKKKVLQDMYEFICVTRPELQLPQS